MREERSSREINTQKTKDACFIITEGKDTEGAYFGTFRDKSNYTINTECLGKGCPERLIKRAKLVIRNESPRPTDIVAIVIDKDENSDKELERLFRWASEKGNRIICLSKPMFDMWLKMHFSPCSCKKTMNYKCKECLEKELSGVSVSKFKWIEHISQAKMNNEKVMNGTDIMSANRGSTVHHLLEKLL